MVQTYSGLTSNTTVPDDHHWHMIHCFDYLRQSIMCCGDMALEGHETTSPKFMGGSDGWDAKHGELAWDMSFHPTVANFSSQFARTTTRLRVILRV